MKASELRDVAWAAVREALDQYGAAARYRGGHSPATNRAINIACEMLTQMTAEAAVEHVRAGGEPPQRPWRPSRRSWERGDVERFQVDAALGEGAYDSEFTSEDEIDDVLSR